MRKELVQGFMTMGGLTIIGRKVGTRPPQVLVWESRPFRQNKPSFLSVRSGMMWLAQKGHLRWVVPVSRVTAGVGRGKYPGYGGVTNSIIN
jgi:hypothetical protein